MIALAQFLARVREIDAEHPDYRNGGSAADGTCDCIGLIIGAIRRAGGKWTGTHGSNYAARYEVDKLRRVTSAADLQVGDMVLKAYEPEDGGWNLPPSYAQHPDQRDYYHAGVVLNVDPLDICHCTSPTTKHDSVLGKWAYAGRLNKVSYNTIRMEEAAMDVLYKAVVATQSDPLRVRDAPETGRILGHVPKGKVVDVIKDDVNWPRIAYNELVGYASGQYLQRVDDNACAGNEPYVEQPNAITIIDDAGHTFKPVGGFRVLVGSID